MREPVKTVLHTNIWKIDSLWEFAVRHRKLKWVLCDNLDEWDWVGGGTEFQEGRGHMYAYG